MTNVQELKRDRTLQSHHKEIIKEKRKSRNYSFDNVRGFLIICVVFGHLLEVCTPFPNSGYLYRTIYSFHMPAFLFLFGYFAKYKPKRILCHFLIPYGIFQTLYILFADKILGTEVALQYTTPYWLLWYLLTAIYYQLLLPLYDTSSVHKKWVGILFTILFALLVGYDNTIGYYGSLSRFFVFQPWFLLGLYYRQAEPIMQKAMEKRKKTWMIISVFMVLASVAALNYLKISGPMLYGSYSYSALNYSWLHRLACMLIAAVWIFFLFGVVRGIFPKKIPFLSSVGQNTLPIFLLHGFVVKAIGNYAPWLVSTPIRVVFCTLLIICLFGNPWVGKGFQFLFSIGERFGKPKAKMSEE